MRMNLPWSEMQAFISWSLTNMLVGSRGKGMHLLRKDKQYDCKPYLQKQIGDGVASQNGYQHRHQGRGQIAIRMVDRVRIVLEVAQTKSNQATGCCHCNLAQPANPVYGIRLVGIAMLACSAV